MTTSTRKKVICNALSAYSGGNVTYVMNALGRYLPEYFDCDIYTTNHMLDKIREKSGTHIALHALDLFGMSSFRRFVWEQTTWRDIVVNSGCDFLYSSANYGILRNTGATKQYLMVQGEVSFLPIYRKLIAPQLSAKESLEYYFRRLLVTLSARNSEIVFFPSEVSRAAVLEAAPDLRERTVVNHLGCRNHDLRVVTPDTWRRNGRLKILYLSVYYPHKDPLTLVRAVERLRLEGEDVELLLTMDEREFRRWHCGPAEFDQIRPHLRSGLVGMRSLSYEEVPRAFEDYDLIVVPSLAETFGFPMVEAMAAGMPVIAADTPIHREIGGDVPLYFKPRDVDHLARCIRRIDENPGERRRMWSDGPQWVRARYDWSRHSRLLADSILARCRP